MHRELREKILSLVRKIPKGRVMTYKALATKVRAHPRAVAAILKTNFDPSIPCWRIIHSDGRIGGFNRGVAEKIRLLKSEGVEIKNGKIDKRYIIS